MNTKKILLISASVLVLGGTAFFVVRKVRSRATSDVEYSDEDELPSGSGASPTTGGGIVDAIKSTVTKKTGSTQQRTTRRTVGRGGGSRSGRGGGR